MSRAWGRAGLVLLAVLLCDQVSKALVVAGLDRGDRDGVFPGIELVYVRNRGIAFGFLEGRGALLTGLTAVALVLLVVYFALHVNRPWLWLPTGLLLGGALGNMLDRIRDGSVVDFIDIPLWPAFNVADMAITAGVVTLLFALEAGPPRDQPD